MNKSEEQVLVTLNPLGYGIKHNEINKVLNPANKFDRTISRYVNQFFQNNDIILNRNILLRYITACNKMKNISVGSADPIVNQNLIQTLTSAKKCYCIAEYLPCILLCASHCEKLAVFLMLSDKNNLIKEKSILSTLKKGKYKKQLISKISDNINNFDLNKLNTLDQKSRIIWLYSGKTINKWECNWLDSVRIKRISHFHHWIGNNKTIMNDALECLCNASKISSKHIDMLNRRNVSKIRKYSPYK